MYYLSEHNLYYRKHKIIFFHLGNSVTFFDDLLSFRYLPGTNQMQANQIIFRRLIKDWVHKFSNTYIIPKIEHLQRITVGVLLMVLN